MQFSSSIRTNLEAFAANMHMPYMPQHDGSLSFALSTSGVLTFTPVKSGNRVAVSLGRRHSDQEVGRIYEPLTRKAGFVPELQNNLHVGISKDNFVYLSVLFEEEQLNQPVLEVTVDHLISELSSL